MLGSDGITHQIPVQITDIAQKMPHAVDPSPLLVI